MSSGLCEFCNKPGGRFFSRDDLKAAGLRWLSLDDVCICYHCFQSRLSQYKGCDRHTSNYFTEDFPVDRDVIAKQAGTKEVSNNRLDTIREYNRMRREYMKEAYSYCSMMYNGPVNDLNIED